MNTKTTAIVVVIALLLGGYVLIFERDIFTRDRADEQSPPTSDISGRPVLGDKAPAVADVQRVRIERPDEPAIVIERDADGWVQTEPVKFPLQKWDIEQVIGDATGLTYTAKLTPAREDLKLDQIGLAPARVTLTLETKDKKTTTLFLGKRTAAGG